MRKRIKQKYIKAGVVIIVFCLITAVTFTLNRMYIRKNTDMVNVAVAVQKIPAFTQVFPDQVKLAKRPRSAVPPEAVLNTAELSQAPYYTGDLGFGQGDIIRTDRLSAGKSSKIGELTSLVAEDKMLISVSTNLVKSCANLVAPGALVDAVVFIPGQGIDQEDILISPLEDPCLANLLVIDKKNAESSPPPDAGREAIPATVTLIMDKAAMETAKALVQYNETGSIYLLPVGFDGTVHLAAQGLEDRLGL